MTVTNHLFALFILVCNSSGDCAYVNKNPDYVFSLEDCLTAALAMTDMVTPEALAMTRAISCKMEIKDE